MYRKLMRFTVASACLALLAPGVALAQTTAEKCIKPAAEVSVAATAEGVRSEATLVATEKVESGAAPGVIGDSATFVAKGAPLAAAVALQLQTSTENSRAALSYNMSIAGGKGALNNFEFSISAPENKGGETEIIRLGDINSDVDVKIAYSHFGEAWDNGSVDNTATLNQILAVCTKSDNTDLKCDKATKVEQIRFRSDCITAYLGQEAYQSLANTLVKPKSALMYGIAGTVGRTTFSYADLTTGAKSKDRKSPWSIEVYGGVISSSRNWWWRTGFKHVENFKAGDKREICSPVGTAGALECKTGIFAPPTDETSEIGYLEYRRFSEEGVIKSVQAKLSYDFENERTAFDAPVYLYSDKDNNLNGGVRVNWNDDDGDVIVGVFVGTAFDLGAMFR